MAEVLLASCADNQGILGSDLRSGATIATFEEAAAHPGAYGVIGSSSGHIFAVQAKKAIWQTWSWDDKKPSYRASLPEKMTAMTFSADALLCFGGSVTGSIYVWQMGTGCLLRHWPAHFREVTQLLVSPDGSFLVSASADANVHVFNIADMFIDQTPKPYHSWSGHSLAVTSLALLPGSGMQQVVASASLDRSVRLWDIASGQPVTSRQLPSAVNSISVGPTGTDILCACKNGEMRLFNPSTGADENSGIFLGHTGSVSSCALNVDGSIAASCSDADKVRIWDMRTRQCISQSYASRNIIVNSVQIVQKWAQPQPLPAFQPFQRLLTRPEDARPVPVPVPGRAEGLKEAMAEFTPPEKFVDRLMWSQAASVGGDLGAHTQQLVQRCKKAETERDRWAQSAADLYSVVVEAGLDVPDKSKDEPSQAAAGNGRAHDGDVPGGDGGKVPQPKASQAVATPSTGDNVKSKSSTSRPERKAPKESANQGKIHGAQQRNSLHALSQTPPADLADKKMQKPSSASNPVADRKVPAARGPSLESGDRKAHKRSNVDKPESSAGKVPEGKVPPIISKSPPAVKPAEVIREHSTERRQKKRKKRGPSASRV